MRTCAPGSPTIASIYPPTFSCSNSTSIPSASRQKRNDRCRSETVSPVWCSIGISCCLSECHEQAAVNDEPVAGEVGILCGYEVADGAGDFWRLGRAAQRQLSMANVDVAEPLGVEFVGPVHHRHARAYEPGGYRVD